MDHGSAGVANVAVEAYSHNWLSLLGWFLLTPYLYKDACNQTLNAKEAATFAEYSKAYSAKE